MQQIFIELWSLKDEWRALGFDGRAAYVEKLAPMVQQMQAQGVEILAWGYNDQNIDRRVGYDVWGVYRLPDRATLDMLMGGIAASGWYDYFDHANAGGAALNPPAVLHDHVMLASAPVFEDIAPGETGTRRTVDVDGRKMSVLEMGSGRPIVFLHGEIGHAYMWRNVLPYAARSGRAIAIDQIGQGRSDKLVESHDGAYSFETHYRYVSRLLEELGVTDDVVFVTQDWGANLAFEWAKDHPGATTAIAYCEPVTPPFDWVDWTPEQIRPMFQLLHSPEGEAFQLDQNGFVEAVTMGVARVLNPTELDAYRAPYAEAGEARRPPLDWAREVPLGGRKPEMAARIAAQVAFMAASPMPKLLFRGEPGALANGRRLEALRTWPNHREVAVRGIHWLPEDDPHGIGRALETWLRETALEQAQDRAA